MILTLVEKCLGIFIERLNSTTEKLSHASKYPNRNSEKEDLLHFSYVNPHRNFSVVYESYLCYTHQLLHQLSAEVNCFVRVKYL